MSIAYDLAMTLHDLGSHGEDGTVAAVQDTPVPTEGYWVGGKFPSLIFNSVHDIDRGELAWWIGSNPAKWYGVWVDQGTGKIYFDGATHMFDENLAVHLGRVRDEIAIWDIKNAREVRL